MKTAIYLLSLSCALTATAFGGLAFADQIVVEGNGTGPCNPGLSVDGGPTAGAFYSVSCSGVGDDATYSNVSQGSLSTGVFGVYSAVSAPKGTYGDSDALASVTLNYFFDTPGLTSGKVVFDVALDPKSSSTPYGDAYIYLQFDNAPVSAGGDDPESSPLVPNGSYINIDSSGPMMIPISVPITNGQAGDGANIQFALTVQALAGCADDNGEPGGLPLPINCSATADLLDPISIQGVSVYDASGDLVPEATLTSQTITLKSESGVSSVPEPGTLALFGFGLVVVGLWRRKPSH